MMANSVSMVRRVATPFTALLCVIADQAAKQWARAHLDIGMPVTFVPSFLKLLLTTNTGAAFSLGRDTALPTILATCITIAVVFWSVKRTRAGISLLEGIGLGCLIGGAVGNLIDRFFLGRVTDFLDFAFVSFPVFNVADVLIDVGIGLVLIASLRAEKQPLSESASSSESVDSSSTYRG